jgi:hypothetical protein
MCSTARQLLAADEVSLGCVRRFCADYLSSVLADAPEKQVFITDTAEVVSALVIDSLRTDPMVWIELALHRTHLQIAVSFGSWSQEWSEAMGVDVALGSGAAPAVQVGEGPNSKPAYVLLPVPRYATRRMRCNVSALL